MEESRLPWVSKERENLLWDVLGIAGFCKMCFEIFFKMTVGMHVDLSWDVQGKGQRQEVGDYGGSWRNNCGEWVTWEG